jgi:hypothetical protein
MLIKKKIWLLPQLKSKSKATPKEQIKAITKFLPNFCFSFFEQEWFSCNTQRE